MPSFTRGLCCMPKRPLPGAPRLVSFHEAHYERRGNPWLTGREQREAYPSDPSENPDMDRYTQAERVKRKAEGRKYVVPLEERPWCADEAKKRCNIVLAMRRKIRKYGVE